MKTLSCIILTAFLFSCGNRSAISKKLSGSDSLVITFNAPNSDSVIRTVSTTEKKAIRKLAGFMDGKKGEEGVCGFDGNMTFYSKGEVLLPVIFQYSEESCRHFLFEMDNKVMNTTMSNEAVDFLKNLVGERRGD
ncbi:MAG TPA: hypothetical protein VK483_00740 [Chitinophagaceae bacterium]|nr:hypothetical protein [Chitinophagaceae bacterium]